MIEIKELGFITNGYEKGKAPRQGFWGDKISILNLKEEYLEAASNIKKGDIIQVFYFAHTADRMKLRTIPPTKDDYVGVFSTRSPHRPNTINVCISTVIKIEKNKIYVNHLDALENSPIVDIKGYSKKLHDNLLR